MLDNLVNADLSGVVGNIRYNYDSTSMMLPALIGMVLMFVTFWLLVDYALSTRKTTDYRKSLMDLYVAGTIKNLAKKDEIDLDKEYKEFLRTLKRRKDQLKELDQVIEDELKAKVARENEKALDSIK